MEFYHSPSLPLVPSSYPPSNLFWCPSSLKVLASVWLLHIRIHMSVRMYVAYICPFVCMYIHKYIWIQPAEFVFAFKMLIRGLIPGRGWFAQKSLIAYSSLCRGGSHKIPPSMLACLLDTTIIPVLFMQPFLGEAVSLGTSWYSDWIVLPSPPWCPGS